MTEANPGRTTGSCPAPPTPTGSAGADPPPIRPAPITYGPPPTYDADGRLRAPVDAEPSTAGPPHYTGPTPGSAPDDAAYYDLGAYSAPPHGAPSHGAPSPSWPTPSWPTPSWPTPSWPAQGAHSPTAPGLDAPGLGARGFGARGFGARGFVAPTPSPDGSHGIGVAGRTRAARRIGPAGLVGLFALVTAVMAGIAPFLNFWTGAYSTGLSDDPPGQFHVNGFGHTFYGAVTQAGSPPGAHDTDYGVPLLLGAVVLALAAIALLTRLRWVSAGLLLTVSGGALVAGVAVEGWMDRGARFSLDDANDHWAVGLGWWLMAAAGIGGAALAAAAAVVIARLAGAPVATIGSGDGPAPATPGLQAVPPGQAVPAGTFYTGPSYTAPSYTAPLYTRPLPPSTYST